MNHGVLEMKVAFGLKAHSGWAALVVVGECDGEPVLVDRCRLDLVDEEWEKQPYHAAEKLKPSAAHDVVTRGIEAAHRAARRELEKAVERERARRNEVAACAVLVAEPMPEWTTSEILSVHFRMHKAEGVLFRDALVRAAERCGLKLVQIPEKLLPARAEIVLRTPIGELLKAIAALGRSAGPPWGKDQKDAALAALAALHCEGHD
jgi:hypothetical protein